MAKKEKIYDCSSCTLSKDIKDSKKVKIFGNKSASLVLVIDMIKMEYLQMLNEFLDIEDIAIIPVISCQKTNRAKLTDVQIKCCLYNFYSMLESIHPLGIITLGNTATNAVLKLKSKIEISKLRNRIIPSHFFNCIVYPTYHPEDAFKYWVFKESFKLDLEKIFYIFNNKYNTAKKVNKKLKNTDILKESKVKQILTFSSFEKEVIKNIHLIVWRLVKFLVEKY